MNFCVNKLINNLVFWALVGEVSRMFQFPDLQQVTVLSKAEWQRIQHELDQHKPGKERMTEEAKEREVLHQQSVEVVKQWSNTIAVSGVFIKNHK